MRREEYTFKVFNQKVLSHLKENTDHPEYSEFWARHRTFTIEAHSSEEALSKIEQKYPADKGFVVSLKK